MAEDQLKPLEQHVFEIFSRNLPDIVFQESEVKIPVRSRTMITEIQMKGLIIYAFYDRENNLLDSNTVVGKEDDYEIIK